jgi:phosphoribosyl-ATP pyrophosphohydrolase
MAPAPASLKPERQAVDLDAPCAVLLEWDAIGRNGGCRDPRPMTDDVLQRLAALIHSRRQDSATKSYTRELLDAGPERCAKKLGEEATETVIAALVSDQTALTREAADLLYHLLVLLESRQIAWSDVLEELQSRMGKSGLAEKAARTSRPS